MKQFYKSQIKEVAATLKFAKPAARQLESLYAKKLTDSEEYLALSKKIASINIPFLKRKARLLNLSYALIRGKDITKVETNPKVPVEMKELENFMAKMEQEFKVTQTKEVAHE